MTEQQDLDNYEDEESPVEAAAIRILSEAINKGKRLQRILIGCVSVLAVLVLAVGGIALREQSLAQSIQRGAITTCQQGNAARAANVETWKFIVGLSAHTNPKGNDPATIKKFLDFIESVNQPRDCSHLYGAQAAG